jgi:two-component system response regulator FixJ
LRWIKAAAEKFWLLDCVQPGQTRTMVKQTDQDRSKTTVFVVDDDAAVRDSLKFLLELEGFRVRVYADGKALLKEADIHGDEYLVVDQVMPGISGLETIDAIRRRGGLNPVVLVISDPTLRVLKGAEARGITVLEKPFLEHVLVDVIRNAMAGQS